MINGLQTDFMKSLTTKSNSYYFSSWITVLFILIFSVPILIISNQLIWAKLSGILSIIILLIALSYWKKVSRLRNEIKDRIVLSVNDLFWIDKHITWFRLLPKDEQKIIENRIGLFLANAKIAIQTDDKNQLIYLAFFDTLFFWEENRSGQKIKLIEVSTSNDLIFEIRGNGYEISMTYILSLLSDISFNSLNKPSIKGVSQLLKK